MIEQFPKYEFSYDNLDLSILPVDNPCIVLIKKDGVLFDFIVRFKSCSKKMLVFGSGAYDSSKLKPPIFQRHTWINYFEDSVIFFNDPTLYLGQFNIGWGFGTKERHYLEEIGQILNLFLTYLQIDQRELYFYGSSAGGFMSLMLAGMFNNSTAIVNNPQTVVNNYYPTHVKKMFEVAASGMEWNEVIDKYASRLNVITAYSMRKTVPNVYYLQNASCGHDISQHLNPFVVGLNQLKPETFGKLTMEIYWDEQSGHNPIGTDLTVSFIKKILSKSD